jgi:hypothetical protein
MSVTKDLLLQKVYEGLGVCLMFRSPLDINHEHHYITINEMIFESLRLH